jgi:folate-binding protein YgfZ
MLAEKTPNARCIIRISGKDNRSFLQGLITNDIHKIDHGLVYAALLSAQGKFQYDFFLFADGEDVMMDIDQEMAAALQKKLMLYRLRADVHFQETALGVARGVERAPEGALQDPRHPKMGWRLYGQDLPPEMPFDWQAHRIRLGIPEAHSELTPDSYILEMGFEQMNGVDFKKGCYVGQEIIARMKHKTQLRKGLRRVTCAEAVATHTPILSKGKEVGFIGTQSGTEALAYLRFDRISDEMTAAGVPVTVIDRAEE